MKNFLLIMSLAIVFTSCKDEKKQADDAVIKQEVVKNLEYHLSNGLVELKNNIGLEKNLNNEVFVKSFAFYENKPNDYELIIELQDSITNAIVTKYTFAIEGHILEKDKEKLTSYSKSKGRLHDPWFFKPELKTVNGKNYVTTNIKTQLRDFDKMIFYLFDREKYNGVKGKKIEFIEYSIN